MMRVDCKDDGSMNGRACGVFDFKLGWWIWIANMQRAVCSVPVYVLASSQRGEGVMVVLGLDVPGWAESGREGRRGGEGVSLFRG